MRILFMGTPDFAATSLKALYDGGFDVVGVFTQPDKPVGRKQKLTPSPVKMLAEKYGTPVFQPRKMRDGTALEIIRQLDPQLIVVVAYGRILPKDILDYPEMGCINIHGSILPKYRGAAPIQWAVLNGDEETGVTSMYMAEGLDSGDMIDVKTIKIPDGCSSGELFELLAPVGAEVLTETVRNIEAGIVKRTPQDESLVTLAPPLTKEMSPILWDEDAKTVVNKVNGLNPWPVATAEIDGAVMKVFKAEALESSDSRSPGQIISADKNGIRITCRQGSVLITELQAPGGKRMKAADFLRGHPVNV